MPVIVLDDAQGLRDELLRELHGLTSLDFDGRDYLTVWLVGHPLLARRLRLQQHAALAQRIVWYAPLVAKTDPQLFEAMLDHGLTAAAAPPDLITSDARDLILRVSRGIPRLISHLLRISLVLADERGLSSIRRASQEAKLPKIADAGLTGWECGPSSAHPATTTTACGP